MKTIKKWAIWAFVLPLFGSIGCAVTPHCVKPNELSALNVGMNKEEARATLNNQYPHDVLASDDEGCEIVTYKYKTPGKKTFFLAIPKRIGLVSGSPIYRSENTAYLFFKEGKLETVLTGSGQKDGIPVVQDMNAFMDDCVKSDGGKGCTDPEALNFDVEAILDDGKCEYCPCGTYMNAEFNSRRPESDCNKRCLPVPSQIVVAESEEECSNCEIIKALAESKANVSVNLELNDKKKSSRSGFDFGSKSKSKTNKPAKSKSKEGFLNKFSFFKK
jgi:hypothetical protein